MAIEGPLKELQHPRCLPAARPEPEDRDAARHLRAAAERGHGVLRGRRAWSAAEIRSNPHPLGRLLLRAGKVAEHDLARARALQAAGDARRLGEILVAQGLDRASGTSSR